MKNNNKNGSRRTRVLAGLLAGFLTPVAYAAPPEDLGQRVADLKAQSVQVKTHPRTGAVRLIGAWHQSPLMVPSVNEVMRAEVAGMEAARHFAPMFGIDHPDYELRRIADDIKRRGGSLHRYRQLHNGVPVLTGELLVNLDRYRRVISMSGDVSQDLDVDTRPQLRLGNARRLALGVVAKWYGVQRRELRASTPELWIVDPKILKPSDRDASLTWRVEVTSRQRPHTIRELLFIDASTAGITLHVDLIERAKNRQTYTANGTSVLPGTLVCDESDPTCAAGDSEAQDAHNFSGDTYDFFFAEHGRDGLDDAGGVLISTVHYSDFFCPNAFWDGTQTVYCTGIAVDDVVAHEITHGVTQNESNLFYYYQSGAINESLSDIWGEFVDLTNGAGNDSPSVRWLIGEDLPPSIGAIRDMANPPALGDPDRMSSSLYWTFASDNGGVHFNSGINNKAAYLMTDGDTFNGYTVNGLGIGKVADIYYEAQTNLLTSGSDYADLYDALLQACQNLIGFDGITSVDCLNVQAAVDAVEMNTDPLNFNPDAPVCRGGGPPNDIFFDDLESGPGQWNLYNASGGATTAWLYDTGYASSGQYMFWGRDSFTSTDGVAELIVDVPLPAGEQPYLHFNHAFGFEASVDFGTGQLTYWDGGFLEYSVDGGATWFDAGPLFESGQDYNGTLVDSPGNPHANHPGFGSESHGYVSTRLDLTALAGQSVRFRWHVSTDGSFTGPFGWVIDDVRVYTCTNEPPPPAEVSLSDATYSISESGPAAIITVNRTGGSNTGFTVEFLTIDLGATAGVDYADTSGTLIFGEGETSQTFNVPVFEDALLEGNETIIVKIRPGTNSVLGSVRESVLSIIDNDNSDVPWFDDALPVGAQPTGSWTWVGSSPPPFSGTQAHQSILAPGFHQHYFENATNPMQVQVGDTLYAYVYLDPVNPPIGILLQWNVNGSWEHRAYWGADVFPWGTEGTASKRYMGPLPPTGEWVRLEVPAGLVGLEGAAVTGMSFGLYDGRATWDTTGVTTAPVLASISFSDATYTVGEGDATAIITVNRSGSSSDSATVDFATADGNAVAGVDYAATNGTLTFAAGESSATVSVPVFDDTAIEGVETVSLTLSNATGAILGSRTDAVLTIVDDDSNDVAWVDDAIPAGATPAGVWTWIGSAPVPYSGDLAHQSTLAAGFHQHYFENAGDTRQVLAGDTLYAHVYLDPANPPLGLLLQWQAGNSWEHRAYWGADVFPWGTEGTPSKNYMGPLPPVGQWARLEIPASVVGLEGLTLTGMAFGLHDGRATWDAAGTTVTPPQPEIAFSDAAFSADEGDMTAVITVSRTGSTSGSATVDYATSDGTAAAGIDYAAASGTLTFADGEDSRTFTVDVFEDADVEGPETVTLTLSNVSGATLVSPDSAVLTITDNDSSSSNDFIWVEDALPAGATQAGPWNWISVSPTPFSGTAAHQSTLAAGFHQHYFYSATDTMQVEAGDTLFTHVYLDPANPPIGLLLQWNVGSSWERRAYWGADVFPWGTEGTPSKNYMGPLPPAGVWVRLEVPAATLGLEGVAVTGMAFGMHDGRATWDASGVATAPPQPEVTFGAATYSVGEADASASITIERTGSSSGVASVDFATADLGAIAGLDYAATVSTVVFADGETSRTVDVPVYEDGVIEGRETVTLTLANASGVGLGDITEATLTIVDNDSSDIAWFDDAIPAGATPVGTWNWVGSSPGPYSGSLSHQSTLAAGFHQHYFANSPTPLQPQAGDGLYVTVYLDPANPPIGLLVQWNVGSSWEHRAYWGADVFPWGTPGTPSKNYMGPLPAAGEWVRLEVPASLVGVEGATVSGMAFGLHDGRATWDTAGRTP